MSLPKFISMLDSRSLYFSRLDQLDDRHEGAISAPAFERAVQQSYEFMRSNEGAPIHEEAARERAALVEAATTKVKNESILVNCWHRNPVESGAMWAVYGREGIAIRSTIGRLYDCTKHYRPSIMIQWIYYVDHAVQDMDPDEPFLFKHRLYAYEQEVRALILLPPGTPAPTGVSIEVDLALLIDGVHLPPKASGLLKSVTGSLLKIYGFPEVEILASAADTIPAYRVRHDEILAELKITPLKQRGG